MKNSFISIVILGSGSSSVSADQGSPGFLIQFGDVIVLMDSGNGTLYRLALAGFSIFDIDIVCLHIHIQIILKVLDYQN